MKTLKMLVLLIAAVFCLTACGTGSAPGNSSGVSAPNPEDSIFHHVDLVKTSTAPQLKITIATDGVSIIHFTNGAVVASALLADAKEIHIEGLVLGYLASGGGKNIPLANNPVVTVEGVAPDDIILITVIMKNGDKLSMNPDWVTFDGSVKMTVSDGLMWYGAAADNPNFTAPVVTPVVPTVPVVPVAPVEQTRHKLALVAGQLVFTPATVDGSIVLVSKETLDANGNTIGVPTPLPIGKVMRIFWNGDVAGWGIDASNPYSALLGATTTSIPVPVHDIGIIRIQASDGMYSISLPDTDLGAGLTMATDGRVLVSF